MRDLRDIAKVRTIAASLPDLPEASQAQLLAALGQFRDAEVQKNIVTSSTSKNPQVRTAALRALGTMGDANVVGLLARAATTSKGTEQKEARNSLSMLHASGADDSLAALLPRSDGTLKVELIKGVGARGTTSAAASLLQSARSPNGAIRTESVKALKSVADSSHLPALVDLLVHPRDQADRKNLELAVAAVAKRMSVPSSQDQEVLRVYPSTADPSARVSLINVLGKIGAPASLSRASFSAGGEEC